ncbi:cupin domain-containing protein [Aeromicrobium terrae]|uniref:Cupin domain-containing protein n=1 Tax=Aeromicrobium terrae TaxID=2498846 RepID=A0A5C8NM61_9ACTN|nr:cupin domain-containing protein [Aeromicrobium terrae]TXL62170.1 cupin domain-containing protein [Aeromicrobium terrae]
MDKIPVDIATAERIRLGTEDIAVLASSADTGGALFAVQTTMRPGGGPPVMHRHGPGEVYYVTEGEFTFYLGEGGEARRIVARAGEVVPLAGDTPHTIRNESQTDAVAFVVHAPGAPMEGFTRAVAALAAQDAPAIEDVLAVAEAHGIELLGPIPSHAARV